MPAKPQVIALEEHFQHPDVSALYGPLDANRAPQLVQRLEDLGELRIKEMDEAGIDVQVISHGAPALRYAGHGVPTTGCTTRCAPIPIASPASPRCPRRTPRPPRRNWSAR